MEQERKKVIACAGTAIVDCLVKGYTSIPASKTNYGAEQIELKAGGDTKERSMNIWQAYYYLACAQCHLGLDMLDAAARDIEEADKRSATDGNFVYMSVLYLRGQLYLQNKETLQIITKKKMMSLNKETSK